jgi:hypothetical protein
VDGHAIDGLGRHTKRRFVKTESKARKTEEKKRDLEVN